VISPGGVLLRPVPRDGRQFFDLSFEPVVECGHSRKPDGLDIGSRVALVTFCLFVGIVVSEDRIAADLSEVEAVVPATRVLVILVPLMMTSTT